MQYDRGRKKGNDMSENSKKRQMILSRKSIVLSTLLILFFGIMMIAMIMAGFQQSEVVKQAMETYHIDASLIAILYTLMVLLLWLPLSIGTQRVYDMDTTSLTLIPIMNVWHKWNIIFYILCNNNVEPFLRKVSFSDITHARFGVEKKFGAWAFSRYTYVLTLYLKESTVTLYINPMDNGPLMPSGHGGYVLVGMKTRKEIVNMMQFLSTNGIVIEDPMQIIAALQNPKIELYDFLESLPLKTKY